MYQGFIASVSDNPGNIFFGYKFNPISHPDQVPNFVVMISEVYDQVGTLVPSTCRHCGHGWRRHGIYRHNIFTPHDPQLYAICPNSIVNPHGYWIRLIGPQDDRPGTICTKPTEADRADYPYVFSGNFEREFGYENLWKCYENVFKKPPRRCVYFDVPEYHPYGEVKPRLVGTLRYSHDPSTSPVFDYGATCKHCGKGPEEHGYYTAHSVPGSPNVSGFSATVCPGTLLLSPEYTNGPITRRRVPVLNSRALSEPVSRNSVGIPTDFIYPEGYL